LTVDNFIALALGNKPWIDPSTKVKVKRPFYNGLAFHYADGFLIQAGDPDSSSDKRYDPGFHLALNEAPEIKFDREGRLAMGDRELKCKEDTRTQVYINGQPAAIHGSDCRQIEKELNHNWLWKGDSQFFITTTIRSDLDGKGMIFGNAIAGLKVAQKIADLSVAWLHTTKEELLKEGRPDPPARLVSVTFQRVGEPPSLEDYRQSGRLSTAPRLREIR